MQRRTWRIGAAVVLTVTLVAGIVLAVRFVVTPNKTHIVGYFANSNGLFVGDEVRILGVPVGEIDSIEPQPERVKITFWVDSEYSVPADATAAIISPQLVTARAIQLTPAYTGGAVMRDGTVLPEDRTAVPLEWDDLRDQLEKLTGALQPTEPGGVSTLGALINTAADNLRGQGTNIHHTIVKLAQAFSALGDHSGDILATIKNLSVVVSALHGSTGVLEEANNNLASVTSLLANDRDAVGNAVKDLNDVVTEATAFIADNREAVGVATDKLASITTAVSESIGDVKQALHVFPNAAQNFANIYQPSQNALTGILALNNFANPITFICGAIQAASRLNAEQSSKLCVQYLAPIVKNRQTNFLPIGLNPFVGQMARPNEITYTEDWLRPSHRPQADPAAPPNAMPPDASPPDTLLPAEMPTAPLGLQPATTTDPAAGLPGIMVPPGNDP